MIYDICQMPVSCRWTIVSACAFAILRAQPSPAPQIRVVTVCELLANINQYANSAVAVVGRLESSVSLIDHYDFLSQDRCPHPVVTHGHVWTTKMIVWAYAEEGMPKPPAETPALDPALIAVKLSAVRETTVLGSHTAPSFREQGGAITYAGERSVPNEWAVIYGRIAKAPDLNKDCGIKGCGGFDVPIVLMTTGANTHVLKN